MKEGTGYTNQIIPFMLLPSLAFLLKKETTYPYCAAFLDVRKKSRGSDSYVQNFKVFPLKSKVLFSFIMGKVIVKDIFLTTSIFTKHEGKKAEVIWGEYLAQLV